ncbi:hypothetical protein AVEN_50113-1 [Araneus ventricosus]|uniref:Uncharacterized protein n=1 Tax=Araneus ventricosus TaxID=182803 RepID=A0A4Y2FRV6_ARAVE|nr:hypothetical protein AVEN_50113-1 [Araneus ventricosus]
MKTFGGLTHGRGVSDSVLAMWTQGMTTLQHICDGFEKFCGVDLTSSKLIWESVTQEFSEIMMIIAGECWVWLKNYNPFPENSNLISISTGVFGDSHDQRERYSRYQKK